VISALYLVFATVHALVWSWGSRAWERAGRPVALTLVLVPSTLLWYDNLRIGLGRVIGEGPLLYALSVPALAWHWTMLPLFVLAALAIARAAGLGWARTRWAGFGFGAVAAALFVVDVPYAIGVLFGAVGPFPAVELKLGCIGDAIRYTASLGPAYFCGPESAVHRVGPGPVVAIVMNVVVLGVGIALWVGRRWPWLAAAAGAMFVAAAGGPAWGTYAPPVANVGEIGFVVGLIATALRFARQEPASDLRPGGTPRPSARSPRGRS
jgi:hypothetical protein